MWQNFQSEIDNLFDKSGSPSSFSSKSKSTMATKDIQQKLQREDYKGEGMTEVCLECLQDTLIEGASGCYECTSCGVIGNQIIDTGAEWRFYGSEDNKSSDPTRCGMPSNELLPQSSLGSVVGYGWKGDTFEIIELNIKDGMLYPTRDVLDITIFKLFNKLPLGGDYHNVSLKMRKVNTRKLPKIRFLGVPIEKDFEPLVCIQPVKNNVPRSDKEIAEIFEIKDITIMTRACKLFQQIWNTHQKSTMKDIMMPASRPGDFIQRFCSK